MLSEIGVQLRGKLERFWRSTVPPDGASPRTVLAANALRTTLAGLLVWLVVQFGLIIPLLVVRKAATLGFSLALLLSVLASLHHLRRGRVKLASWILVSALWLLLTADAVLSGGSSSHAIVGLLSVTVITAWLFESEVTFIAAGLFLGTTLGLALLENAGVVLPRYFPSPPLVVWSLLCLHLAIATLPLTQVIQAMHQALGETRGRATFNQAVRDSLTTHIAVIDANGVIIATNKAWDRFALENGGSILAKYGLGANYLDACAKAATAGDPLAQKALTGIQAVRDGPLSRFDLEYPCDSPSEDRWFAMHATRLGATGRSLVVSHENITDRKRAEEALRHANAYNRRMIEASLDPLVTIGPDGSITDVNRATEVATGHAREELVGTDFSNYFTESEQAREGYERVFREGIVRDYPLGLRHRDGSVRSVLYNASTYRDEGGKVIGVFAAARDVTAAKQAEQNRLEHLEELERWRKVTLGREERVRELKGEINRLLARVGEPPRYKAQAEEKE